MSQNDSTTDILFWYNSTSSTTNNDILLSETVNASVNLALSILGLILNYLVFSVMTFAKVAISETASILLRFQLLSDGTGCLLLIITQFKIVKNQAMPLLYKIICTGLDRGMFMWTFYVASAYNIVAVAIQRYFITVYPFKQFKKKHSYLLILLEMLATIALIAYDYGVQMKIDVGKDYCSFSYTVPIASVIWLFAYYVFPVIIIGILYSKVIIVLKKSGQIQSSQHSSKTAEGKVLKNAVAVALFFTLLAAPNTAAYILLHYNLIHRSFWEGFFRRFTYLCIMINSASTPIVYLIFLSSIREKIFQVFCKCTNKKPKTVSSVTTSTTQI